MEFRRVLFRSDVYYLSGNAPHRGGEDQAYILFDAGHRALQVGLWENGKLGIHSTPGSAIAPTAKIRSLLDRSPPTDATAAPGQPRSAESRGGKEGARTCRTRWSADN